MYKNIFSTKIPILLFILTCFIGFSNANPIDNTLIKSDIEKSAKIENIQEKNADKFMQNGNYLKAVSEYKKALENDLKNEQLTLKLVRANMLTKNYDEANKLLSNTAFQNEENLKVVKHLKNKNKSLQEIDIATEFLNKNDNKEAKEHFKAAINFSPTDGLIPALIGGKYAIKFQEDPKISYMTDCIWYSKMAEANDPKDPNVFFLIADNMLILNSEKIAGKNFKKYIELSPNKQEAYLSVAGIYWWKSNNANRYKKVVNNIEKAIAINPDIPFAYVMMLAAAYTKSTGNEQKAVQLFKEYASK